jgi:hypothetical protein
MPGVTYQRSSAGSPLFISTQAPSSWSAFLLSSQSSFNAPSIDLTACWRERGAAFLFAKQAPPKADKTFTDALWQAIFAKTPQFYWNALVFLLDPAATPSPDNIWVVPVTQPATLQFRVHEDTPLLIGNGFSELRLKKDAEVFFHFSGESSEIRFENGIPNPFELFFQGQIVRPQQLGDKRLSLSLSGPNCGCFLFDLYLTPDEQLPGLGIGLKYFFEENNSLSELHFPVFHPGLPKTGVFFKASIDPVALLDPARTSLAFTGETSTLSTPSQTSPTFFNTPFKTLKGHAIRLHPRAGKARLVFSRRGDGAACYLLPAGDFTVEILAQNGKKGLVNGHAKWLTGFSGTETLLFPYDEGKVALRFHPHQPAFATSFPPAPVSHTNRLQMSAPLSSRCLTAWLSIVHDDGKPLRYVSQPDGGPLYKPDAEDAGTPVFDYIDTTVPLPNDFSLPITPALNLAFQNQVLSPARKFQTDQLPAPPPPSATVHSTTPQGILIKLQPQGNAWTELLAGEDASGSQLRFDKPPLPLQRAFQTNQQFLVITNNTHLGDFHNELNIAGWPFVFNTGKNQRLGDYKNVVIFKFCNESLLDRIKNPALWTQPRDFNGAKSANPSDLELQLISRWLQDYVNDAIENQAGNPYFQDFIRIVQNPGWNGVLVLKADVRLDGLPEALLGLAGGIDTSRFNAHHVGMEINQVESGDQGSLRYREKSSLFGLIYYQDPNYQRQQKTIRNSGFAPETFDFRVLTLFAQFKNSELINFSSKIRVTLRELFREKTQDGATDFIDLDGAHEKKDGKDVYTFLSDRPVQFFVGSGLYQYIEIDRATFATNPREQGSQMVSSLFAFTGNLLFGIPQEGFDILSYGSSGNEEVKNPGLAFSNFRLNLSFSLDDPARRSFHADYNLISINLRNSPLRDGSLLAQLPLEPYAFITAGEGANPKDDGFLPVELAGLPTVPFKDNWYGILCSLNLGNAGGLSAQGNLVSQVLLAWAPGSKPGKHSLFMGLRLPGISLQGVLKLSIDTLQLVSTPTGFILKLNDIGIKFLGLLKIPPGGATSFYLFGNPEDGKKEIGWYASYNKYQ